MKTLVLSIFVFFSTLSLFSQVGINTTTPSAASALDIKSSADGLSGFGGLMPPNVTIAQRDLIPVSAADDGLLAFVTDGIIRSLQIYNGVEDIWETIYTLSISPSPIIAGWEIAGTTGISPFPASYTDASVSVGGLTRGDGLNVATATNSWGASGFDLLISSQASAIDAENFVTFSITPTIGENVSLTWIDPYNIRRSNTGPITGIWQYSINGFDYYNIGSEIYWGSNVTATGNLQSAINLSSINELQNLTSATTVTFRIVSWDASGAGGTWYINEFIAGNDLIIRGNVN